MIADGSLTHEASEGGQRCALPDRRLWVAGLQLSTYRNYEMLSLSLAASPVVLLGPNGAGKTNLIEALSLLAAGQGLRGAAYPELTRREAPEAASASGGPPSRRPLLAHWAISADLRNGDEQLAIGTGLPVGPTKAGSGAKSAGRVVKINGEAASGSGALADIVRMSWLTPAMDGLFTGPANERRRFLDRMTLSFDPSYRRMAGRFERAMRQRNRLLEQGERSSNLFAGLESQMAEAGVAIAAARVDAVERLRAGVATQNSPGDGRESPFPWAELSLEGDLEEAVRHTPALDVEDDYIRRLAQTRDRDRIVKRTLLGPHRTDLSVVHGPKAAPARQCSTGEQKALLLGVVLAHAWAVKQINNGIAPLILLDEIAAHLDEVRRAALFREIERLGVQAWMTGTEAGAFSALRGRAQFFVVTEGRVTPASVD
jgi:DNA replication and repair protein RecF